MIRKNAKQSHSQPSKQSLTGSRRTIGQVFNDLKPRIAARGTAKARQLEQAEAEADQSLTFWGVIVRLLPLWALLVTILIIEPTLPFRAVGSVIRWIGSLIPDATPTTPVADPVFIVKEPQNTPTPGELPLPNWSLEIAPVFTSEVQYWEKEIGRWSQTYRIKPNLIATLMQIESCGNPTDVSGKNTQGLFQVSVGSFQAGEDPLSPETNALRGLTTFAQMIANANGDLGLAFAAYNGGPSIFYTSPAEWSKETQVYQYWGGGIYDEAEMGLSESPTLQEWLDKGGSDLCQQAAESLGLSPQN
jgi:hypothetical protein